MNHIGVSLQGPPNNSSFEYLRQTGRRSQPTNESTLLLTIKQALRGYAGEATDNIYNHWLPDDENPDGRELSWHTKQAVLSMGGIMVKKWSFWEDKENIQTACLGFLEQNALESRKSFSPSANFTSVADEEGPPVGSGDPGGRPVFGPFGAREQRPRKFPDEHELIPAVFIFFRSVVRIYLQNGMSYVISIPFVVRKAWPISPHGVMIQRILEPAEQLEAELTGDPPLPTIFTITSPFAEPSAVGLASGITGGLDDNPVTLNEETTKNVLNSVPPTEMVVNITAGNSTSVCHRKNVVVSVDLAQHTLSIWRYAYAKPRQQQQQQEESSAAAARKKRQSMGNHARRTSAAFEGDRLDSKHHGPSKEPDLAGLGAAASVAVATSMSSVIAGTQSTIPESEPIPTADERMTANYWMERIYSEQLTPESAAMWNIMQVAIWDERWDGSALKSHLGIVFKDSMKLRIFELRHEEKSRIKATFFREDPAAGIARVISTRPKIYDALVVQPDGTVILLAQGASAVGFRLIEPASAPNGEPKAPRSTHGVVVGIRDERWSQVTLAYTDGWDERIDMDLCPKSRLVNECMQMLAFVIPQEEYFLLHMDLINQWSSKGRIPDPEIELDAFQSALYTLLGVENEPLPEPSSPWDTLSHSPLLARMREDPALRRLKLPPKAPLPAPKPLSRPPHPLHSLAMYTLHTLAEDLRVLKGRHSDVIRLAPILARLALPVRPEWADYWKRLVPDCLDGWPHPVTHLTNLLHVDDRLPVWPQDIYVSLFGLLAGGGDGKSITWNTPATLSRLFHTQPAFAHDTTDPLSDLHEMLGLYSILSDPKTPSAQKRAENAIQKLVGGAGVGKLDMLTFGAAAPIREALRTCQLAPPAYWPLPAYSQIGRNDLAASASEEPEKLFAYTEGYRPAKEFIHPTKPRPSVGDIVSAVKTSSTGELESVSGVELGQEDFTQIRFGQDRRLEEVARLLNSSATPTIKVGERPELSEMDQTKEHQAHVIRVAERTLALPFGRAMFTFGSVPKVTREAHTIPKIEYAIKILPLNVTVGPDQSKLPPDAIQWGEFHNGVAAGLRIGPLAKGVESSWITFNKPSELTPEHAGFLFALGLTGHLRELMTWHTFQYLTPKHDQTSIAVLLGLAASNVGKGTQKVVKLLAVHTPALLPTPDIDLNVHLLTQAAGLSGLGLLYMGLRNRRMAEVCLTEISRKDLVQPDITNEHREAYTFSAAIAFGMVMLGKGSSIPADLDLLQRLSTLIHGDLVARSREKISHPFDFNLTSPAASIALGLFYLKTERQDVADMLTIPDTSIGLNRLQPNFLMIRTIARGLIMWEKVQPTNGWIMSQIPDSIRAAVDAKEQVVDDSFQLAYYHILAGCCFVIGLKYAGTARQEAYSVIVKQYDLFSRLAYTNTGPAYDLKIRRAAIRDGLTQISLALCMVMAGTGEISCLRRIRFAYGVFQMNMYHPNFRYGVHLATMQSLGLLFLGAGRYTLGTSDAAIACMVASFFPRPHITPADNKSYLQALRHLWVLAVEPRCLIARDVDTGEVVYLPVKINVKEGDVAGTSQLISPTLIPDISKLHSIRVDTPRYWPFYLDIAKLSRHKEALLRTQTLYVKRRTAFLSYTEDPRGSRSLFVRSGSSAGDAAILDFPQITASRAQPSNDLSEFITSFSNNVVFLAWADHLCRSDPPEEGQDIDPYDPEHIFQAYCHAALLDCIMQDKPETLQSHLTLYKYRHWDPQSRYFTLTLQDLRFASEFYGRVFERRFSGRQEKNPRPGLVRETAVMGAMHGLREVLEDLRVKEDFRPVLGTYAKDLPLGDKLRNMVFTTLKGKWKVQGYTRGPRVEKLNVEKVLAWYLSSTNTPASSVLECLRGLAQGVLEKQYPHYPTVEEHEKAQVALLEVGIKELIHMAGGKMTNNHSAWTLRSVNDVCEAWKTTPI